MKPKKKKSEGRNNGRKIYEKYKFFLLFITFFLLVKNAFVIIIEKNRRFNEKNKSLFFRILRRFRDIKITFLFDIFCYYLLLSNPLLKLSIF